LLCIKGSLQPKAPAENLSTWGKAASPSLIIVGNVVGHINKASHPGQLSLVIPPWIGEISILAMVSATVRDENGEFCITAGGL